MRLNWLEECVILYFLLWGRLCGGSPNPATFPLHICKIPLHISLRRGPDRWYTFPLHITSFRPSLRLTNLWCDVTFSVTYKLPRYKKGLASPDQAPKGIAPPDQTTTLQKGHRFPRPRLPRASLPQIKLQILPRSSFPQIKIPRVSLPQIKLPRVLLPRFTKLQVVLDVVSLLHVSFAYVLQGSGFSRCHGKWSTRESLPHFWVTFHIFIRCFLFIFMIFLVFLFTLCIVQKCFSPIAYFAWGREIIYRII